MYKGLVIEITKEYAIVLAADNQYCKIIAKDGLSVGQKIFFFEEDLVEDRTVQQKGFFLPTSGFWKKAVSISAMAACLLFFLLFGNITGIPMGNNAYYAVVSVDINPSVEMKINKNKCVTQVEVLNQDGYKVAGEYLVGLKVEEAIVQIVNKAAKYNYLAEKDTVLLAASVNSTDGNSAENFAKEFIEELTKADLPEEYSYLYLSGDLKDYSKARKEKLSLGKYEMMVMTKEKVKPEEVKKLKVRELLEDKEIQSELAEKNPKKHVWLEDKDKKTEKDTKNNGKNKHKDKNKDGDKDEDEDEDEDDAIPANLPVKAKDSEEADSEDHDKDFNAKITIEKSDNERLTRNVRHDNSPDPPQGNEDKGRSSAANTVTPVNKEQGDSVVEKGSDKTAKEKSDEVSEEGSGASDKGHSKGSDKDSEKDSDSGSDNDHDSQGENKSEND